MANIYTHTSHIASDVADAVSKLENKLAEEFKDKKGDFWIIPSADFNLATGIHDVDLILMGRLDDIYTIDIANYNDIQIKSFITTIEVKSHDADGIFKDGTHLYVKYPGKVVKDVTHQSQKQKETLCAFLKDTIQCHPIPRVSNIIWMNGINYDDFDETIGLTNSNIITSDFTVSELFDAIGRTHKLSHQGEIDAFANLSIHKIKVIADYFCKKSNGADSMSLKRINLLQQDNSYLKDLDKKTDNVIVLSGHAGTGKTIMLLNAANHLMVQGYKCLYLTYNNALVSDLKHTISIMQGKMADIKMSTMHSFLINILYSEKLWQSNYSLENNFFSAVKILYSRIKTISPIEDYDYVFIDEAQDWANPIPEILKELFRTKHLVIADGVDQFMQTSEQAQWGNPFVPTLKKCLRQKRNLSVFAKIFASKMGVYWNVQPNEDFPGGKVRIYEAYTPEIHSQLIDDLKLHGCNEYDMMLLASKSFAHDWRNWLKDSYNNFGINVFDGIDEQNRDNIYDPIMNKGQARIYTYESCRGLEAWTTVCLRFDELFIKEHSHDYNKIQYSLARNYMLTLWSLMPITRAIDTLVLVVTGKSYVSDILKEIADENPDFVTYIKR